MLAVPGSEGGISQKEGIAHAIFLRKPRLKELEWKRKIEVVEDNALLFSAATGFIACGKSELFSIERRHFSFVNVFILKKYKLSHCSLR